MTTVRTPAQRGRANRRAGANDERDIARWLRTNGFSGAERAVRTGYRTTLTISEDHGDITGTPGVAWQITRKATLEEPAVLARRLAETEAQRAASGADIGLLVQRRPRCADPGRWWCWMRAYDFAALADDAETCFVFPVRIELGDAVQLLRAAGYGDPFEESA